MTSIPPPCPSAARQGPPSGAEAWRVLCGRLRATESFPSRAAPETTTAFPGQQQMRSDDVGPTDRGATSGQVHGTRLAEAGSQGAWQVRSRFVAPELAHRPASLKNMCATTVPPRRRLGAHAITSWPSIHWPTSALRAFRAWSSGVGMFALRSTECDPSARKCAK